ncbi:hypothetical protein E4U55_003253 [Claviceps digitariae]|nr:hypothetical protein E4U55_003253 [Claviceps digitariae]
MRKTVLRNFVSKSPKDSKQLAPRTHLLPQRASRPSNIESGDKTRAIADAATFTSSGVRDLWRSAQAAEVNQIQPSQDSNPFIVIEDNDPATTSIEPASSSKTTPGRRGRSIENPETIHQPTQQEARIEEALGTAQQPWKRFKPQTPEKDAARISENSDPVCVQSAFPAADTALADDIDRTCSPMQDSLLSAQARARQRNSEDSLQLEPAMVRRKNWTPPKQVTTYDDALGSSDAIGPIELEDDDDAKTTSFETLLTAYKCSGGVRDENGSHQSDGSASKKRKVTSVQPVQTTLVPSIAIANTVGKKKASRKKPRTITALATAAYKQATQVDSEDVAAAQETNRAQLPQLEQATVQNKAKQKPRKRPPKSTTTKKKKKIQPPKPILFSPETALKQVAQQDFVFGTSSQLAREQSPTFLRDLQRAMKSSNQLDDVVYSTPLNSDSIEPLECRPKLWDAAARDADGDLFDVEVINLTGSDACAPPTHGEDPFGYCKGDSGGLSPQLPSAVEQATDASARDDDGFINLSDILPASSSALLPAPKTPGMDRFPTSSPLPECHVGPHPAVSPVSNQELETVMSQHQPNMQTAAMSVSAPIANHVTRPAFEDYTDAQLSTEVSRYGFKPIKRRSAMLALLEQCWQQKLSHSGHHVRMQSTVATSSKLAASSPAKRPRGRPRKDLDSTKIQLQDSPPSTQVSETPKRPRGRPRKVSASTEKCQAKDPRSSSQISETPKRPRGRPRKDSDATNNCQAQDPPPSAQVPETPKRPRGRPKKNAETSPSIAKAPKEKKATAKKTKLDAKTISKRKATPKKAKAGAKMEIPDSESDLIDILDAFPSSSRPRSSSHSRSSSRSSSSSRSRSFSSSRSSSRQRDIDLTMSLQEDAGLSLGMASTDSQSNLFEYITRAITTAPRTTVPTEPSWHEKILLYDPIVLEDLTTWLNSGQLTRVGCDEEINPLELKKWCESKSICCLSKVTLRGKLRKRY